MSMQTDKELAPLPHSLVLLHGHFETGLGGLFASPLVLGGKYWNVLAIVYGLFRRISHSGEPIEPALVVNGPQAGRRIQSL